jgi:hypothetical protein
MRDTGGFELLHGGLAKGALRAEHSEGERTILCAERSARDPEHRQFAQQQSVFPIRESNGQREIKLTLVEGFNESAITLDTQLYLSSWIKCCELPQNIRQQRSEILWSTDANGAG